MKPLHNGTLVLNETPCGYDPDNYPRIDSNGEELPGHGVYILDENWQKIIQTRNELLEQIDEVLDSKLSKKKKDACLKYRNKLESIERDFENPADVVWPDFPNK